MNVTPTHGLLGVSGIDDLGGRIPALGPMGCSVPFHPFHSMELS